MEDSFKSANNAARRTKLTGRKFYESIGSPKLILAPMVDRSEFAWRLLTRSFVRSNTSKPLLAYSPMFHARLFAETSKNRSKCFQPTRLGLGTSTPSPEAQPFLDGNPSIDRPLIVQFCANNPDELLAAARFVEPHCDAVDLNLGCPQGIAKKGNYGAFLQEDWDLIYNLINKLHNELSVPVTAKMRILDTKEKTLAYARKILAAGASIITVHGRRREQKGHNTGTADWSYIRYLRDNLPPDTVIFSNGNILSHADLHACLEATGADGVMSAEGNLSDPTIFGEPPSSDENQSEYWKGEDGQEGYRADAVFRRYMDIIYRYVLEREPPQRPPLFVPSQPKDVLNTLLDCGSEDVSQQPPTKKQKRELVLKPSCPSLRTMQGHLFGLLRQLVSRHTDIRDALAKSRAGDMEAFENVLQMVERVVAKAISEYGDYPELSKYSSSLRKELEGEKSNNDLFSSSAATIAKYRRPWWVCQPYVRPLPSEAYEMGAMKLSKKELAKLQEKEKHITFPTPSISQATSQPTKEHDVKAELPREAVVCG